MEGSGLNLEVTRLQPRPHTTETTQTRFEIGRGYQNGIQERQIFRTHVPDARSQNTASSVLFTPGAQRAHVKRPREPHVPLPGFRALAHSNFVRTTRRTVVINLLSLCTTWNCQSYHSLIYLRGRTNRSDNNYIIIDALLLYMLR